MLGVLLTILDDTAIVLVTILNYDVAKRLAYYDMRTTAASSSDMAQLVSKYESKLKVPSYILLAAMILQTIACICLCLARLIKPFKSELGNQDEEHSQRSTLAQVQLESLKKSTSKQSAGPSLIPDTNLYASSHSMYKR